MHHNKGFSLRKRSKFVRQVRTQCEVHEFGYGRRKHAAVAPLAKQGQQELEELDHDRRKINRVAIRVNLASCLVSILLDDCTLNIDANREHY